MRKSKGRGGILPFFPIERFLYSRDLILRRFKKADASTLRTLLEKNRNRLAYWFPPLPLKLTTSIIERLIRDEAKATAAGTRLDCAVILAEEEKMIGKVSLHSLRWGISWSGGLAFWIDSSFGRLGLMKQAVCTISAFAFEELGLKKIWAETCVENLWAKKLLLKVGFVHEGFRRAGQFLAGKWRDFVYLSLLREEYEGLAENWIKKGWLGT